LALHISIGNSAKTSPGTGSVSGQFSTLRNIFKAASDPTDPVCMSLNGTLPIIFHVDQADEIGSVLRLKKEFNLENVVIVGGAEAAVLAPQLAAAGVPVVLSPSQAFPAAFETQRSLDSDPATLIRAGVTLAIAQPNDAFVRNLRWDAGFVLANGGFSVHYYQALATVTSNVAKIFGLPHGVGTISDNTQANFVLYDGDPLTIGSKIVLVALGGYVSCQPQQL